ncbi:hypothetical protein [Microlunatus ginsengisoli]|uniref:Pesticidal crystal protein N-terminal domain-containing protein n=1 Tax=Microlunatus ginsengisoli TaxID=363863 RepID=A0ABP7AIL0_9ACTN
MSAQDDYVRKNLELLREMQISGMDPEEVLAWQDKIDKVNKSYTDARAIENDEKKTADERKRAKEVADGIAKAAPAITKSVISAIKAFSKGDAINGVAEIMDICASMAPLISTFLNAAGPEGALVGAFFSVVGQILRCFGPKEESDLAKFQKMLEELNARTELQGIKAVHDDVLAYAMTLFDQAADLQKLLAQPVRTHDDFLRCQRGIGTAHYALAAKSMHDAASSFENWKVLEYLKDAKNHNVALWPTVLGVWCKTYSDMLSTMTTITVVVQSDDMAARMHDVDPKFTTLEESDRRDLSNALEDLASLLDERRKEYSSCNKIVLPALRVLTGVAQRWGLYGITAKNHALKFVTGPQNVKSGKWNDVSDRNYYHQLMLVPDAATVIRDGQVSEDFNFEPSYHCFVLKSTSSEYPGSSHWVDHLWVHADTGSVDGTSQVLDNFTPAFTDIWAEGQTDKGLDVYAGTAEGTGAPGSVMAWTMPAKDDFTAPLERVNWWPQTKWAVGTIRAVASPVSAAGDADEAAIPPGGADRLLYASMRDSTDIYVNTGNQDHYIPGPAGWGPCTGLAVDQTFLWLYQPYGFAVVSHASVLSHLKGTRPAPGWLTYPRLPDSLLGEHLELGDNSTNIYYQGWPQNFKPPLLGLISLSPCDDGTLLAAVVHRTIEAREPNPKPLFWIDDRWTIQTAPYQLDIVTGQVTVGSWTQIPGEAWHVQKLPMPGWTLLSSLRARLA